MGILLWVRLAPPNRSYARNPDQETLRPEFTFREFGLEAGLKAEHQRYDAAPELKHIENYLNARGASISVADFDNDGYYDFYYTSSKTGSPNSLYRNNGDGTFSDVAVGLGVSDLNRDDNNAMSALWIDYDNDGWLDLFVVNMGCNRLYRNLKGRKFVDVTLTAGDAGGKPDAHGFCASGRSALAFDYNRDGNLDIYVSNFNPKDWRKIHDGDFYVMFPSVVKDDSGPANFLLKNNGDGTFSEVAKETGVANHRWTQSAGASDFDNDGWSDLFVANDFSGPDRIYMNKEGRHFELLDANNLKGMYPRHGMNGDIADVNDDGFMDIYNTKITKPWFTSGTNQMWMNNGGKEFTDSAGTQSAASCGWAWAARFIDLANRGKKDIFVVNGMHSGSDRRSYWYATGVMASMGTFLLKNAKSWPPMNNRSFSGHEKNCVFYNTGGQFSDVAAKTGVVDDWDGRGIAALDVTNNGLPDVVIGNIGKRALLYRNQPQHSNQWLGLKLRMARKNRFAVGTKVTLWHEHSDGRMQRQAWEVSAGNGFASQSDERLRFGLGPAPVRVLRAEVRWPDGKTEALPVEKLRINAYNTIHAKK